MTTRRISRPGRSWVRVSAVAAAGALALAACSSSGSTGSSGSGKKVLSIAFGSTYVMATAALAPAYYGKIATEFMAAHPGVTVNLIPIKGGPNDILTKLSLLYRSPSTAPTIAEIDTFDVAKFSAAGYFLPLDSYLPKTNWWSGFPKAIQQEGTYNGHVYAISQGENTQALMYNMAAFKKAGLPVPWQPKNWQDVLNAAMTIKAKIPGLTPMWAEGGTADGTEGAVLGVGNLLQTSSDPTVFDAQTQKWVVDSPGLRETFNFIHQLAINNLNAPVSQLFDPNATGNANGYMKSPGAAIGLASNYWGSSWLANKAPDWQQAAQIVGVAPLPTSHGQGIGYGTLMSGWDQAIYKNTPDPSLAFQLLDFMNQKEPMLQAANNIEFIPPVVAYATAPEYLNFAPPFQAEFAKFLPIAQEWPINSDFPAWSQGFQEATGALIQHPGTSVDDAINIMKNVVSQQIGADKTETHSG